jgi:hypothetical protein
MMLLSSPQFGVARTTFNEPPGKRLLGAVVNGVVGPLGSGDQVFGVENPFLEVDYLVDGHRIHVMNQKTRLDLEALDTKVASVVSKDNLTPNSLPIVRSVELLVDPPVVTESLGPYATLEV